MITVVGSYNTDMVCRAAHLPKPGETVMGSDFMTAPGGKGANQAVAAVRAGSKVTMVAKFGDDNFGRMAIENLKNEGIDMSYSSVTNLAPTGTAQITVDAQTSENTIIVISGANVTFTNEDVEKVKKAIIDADILLVQLEINLDIIAEVIKIAGENGVKVVLNPAPYSELPSEVFKHVTYVTPNETEAGYLSGIDVVDDDSAVKAAAKITEMGVQTVIMTMGKRGCLVYENGKHYFVEAFSMKNVVDTTGAGDAFNGGFSYAISKGKSVKDAVRYANAVAGLSVTKLGAAQSTATKEEIENFLVENGLADVL